MSNQQTESNRFQGDDSLKKTAGDESRGSRSSSDVQRHNEDGTVTTRSERRAAFINEWQQQALPTPPEIPGYHLCWLSTTSSYDPIHKRMRLGYEPVRSDEVEGLSSHSLKSGEFKGFIAANEMLLFKIPNERYQEIMAELHHYQPLEQEEAIRGSLIRGERDNNGKTLGEIEGDGFAELGASRKEPHFI